MGLSETQGRGRGRTTLTKYWVAGSRGIVNYKYVANCLRGQFSPDDIIRTGKAKRGVDGIVEMYCKRNGYKLEEGLPADWKLGKHAGFLRNTEGVEWSDRVIVIWDGKSPGSKHVIGEARRLNKHCKVFRS